MNSQTIERVLPTPVCSSHPGSLIRRFRTHGPRGPGVYPQCVPIAGGEPHLLDWPEPPREREEEFSRFASLSESERDVLDDAASGMTVLETAAKRGKGHETVKTQRKSILLKLDARNIAQAVALAMRERRRG